jgi:uncharacterized protein YgiB involved in biofilm formation
MRRRRAPASITLVLIGSAALAGCGDETSRRDIYRSSVDCRQDWGDTSECVPVRSGPHVGYYYGPSYRDNRRNDADTTTGPRDGSRAIATAHLARNDTRFASSSSTHGSSGSSTARGGFGSTASSHSSGG